MQRGDGNDETPQHKDNQHGKSGAERLVQTYKDEASIPRSFMKHTDSTRNDMFQTSHILLAAGKM